MRIVITLFLLLSVSAYSNAQELEEVLVTASMTNSSLPGKHLRRTADNLLLRIRIVNDSRDEEQREKEIHKTLFAALGKAGKNQRIGLSAVSDGGFVLPITQANYRIELDDGNRPDTSQAFFRAKMAVPDSVVDGEALVLELKRFISGLDMVGRTEVFVDSDVEVSVINPNQYRADTIRMFAEDVKQVTAALGEDYRVVVEGIDRPIEWVRAGSLSVAIFIPYEYTVVPTSLNSLMVLPGY